MIADLLELAAATGTIPGRRKTITKNGAPYLQRWYLIEHRRVQLMLHHICQPDADRWPHDHPWSFLAIVLSGGYVQTRVKPSGRQRTECVRRFNLVRSGTFHRIETIEPDTWTLVIGGRRRRPFAYRVPWDEVTLTPRDGVSAAEWFADQ